MVMGYLINKVWGRGLNLSQPTAFDKLRIRFSRNIEKMLDSVFRGGIQLVGRQGVR